jgi:hypothetical protein
MNANNNFKVVVELINRYNKVREVASKRMNSFSVEISNLDRYINDIQHHIETNYFEGEEIHQTFIEFQLAIITRREEKDKMQLTRIFEKMDAIKVPVQCEVEIKEDLFEEVAMIKQSVSELLKGHNGTFNSQQLQMLNKLMKEIEFANAKETEIRKIHQSRKYESRSGREIGFFGKTQRKELVMA